MKAHFELMVNYNAVMNQKISDAISGAHEKLLWADNKAFFGSILGTLNHLMVGDLIWLRRFNYHASYPDGFNILQSLANFQRQPHLRRFYIIIKPTLFIIEKS